MTSAGRDCSAVACARRADAARAAVSAESASLSCASALSYARSTGTVSTRSVGSGATRSATRRACCGTTMSATSVVTNAPTLTAPMKTGRRAALRARALIHAARGAPKIRRSHELIMTERRRRMLQHAAASAASVPVEAVLLNRDDALHVHREVRRTGVVVCTRRDAGEGDRVLLVRVHHHRAA